MVPGFGKANNYEASLAWALTGYYGWPDLDMVGTPNADRKHCSTGCPVKYQGGDFKFFWATLGWNGDGIGKGTGSKLGRD